MIYDVILCSNVDRHIYFTNLNGHSIIIIVKQKNFKEKERIEDS